MNHVPVPLRPVALAALLMMWGSAPAWAQSAAPAPAPASAPASAPTAEAKPTEAPAAAPAAAEPAAGAATAAASKAADKPATLNLDQIIVTGTSQRTSKLAASVAISTLGAEQLKQGNAASAAEALRSVPGVRSESSGGESNANVTIRGVPISAGGARYVQFQEDGLPVLQFGDLNFATPDTFMRVDNVTERLEVVRGGSASTLATNAPGGIINFISKTGQDQGGVASVSLGLAGLDQTRYEFGYGGSLGAKTRFYLGGFYREGEGARHGGVRVEEGMQIRGNITQTLDAGYVRFSFKHLDDRTPTLLPLPVRYVDGSIQQVPGFDPRKGSLYSPYWLPDVTLTGSNGHVASNVNDGLTAKADAVGVEAEFDLGNGFKLQEKFRHARQTGRFIGVFPGDDVHAAPAGTTYVTGPNAGRAYSGNVVTGVVFNTSLDDLGLTANDLRVSKGFKLGEGSTLQATGGLYTSSQKVGMTWSFNQYTLEATGDKPALLQAPGLVNGSAAFGGCCQNFTDSTYTTRAAYALLQYETGPLSVEVSVRADRLRASGLYRQTLFDGGTPGQAYNLAAARIIDYRVRNTAYSLGANLRLNKDTAVFARVSEGVSFNGDRITFFNEPDLVNGRSSVIPVNEVQQLEAGLKWRSGALQTFATLFYAKTDESNVDVTTSPIQVTATKYDAKGIELEGAYRIGALRLAGGITYTDASVKASSNAALVGKTPRRTAKLIYQLSPTLSLGDLELGASIQGTTRSRDDTPAGPLTVTLPAYTVVNAFASYYLSPRASVRFGVNNLTNVVGYTESNDGRGAARSINGRTAKVTLSYEL